MPSCHGPKGDAALMRLPDLFLTNLGDRMVVSHLIVSPSVLPPSKQKRPHKTKAVAKPVSLLNIYMQGTDWPSLGQRRGHTGAWIALRESSPPTAKTAPHTKRTWKKYDIMKK